MNIVIKLSERQIGELAEHVAKVSEEAEPVVVPVWHQHKKPGNGNSLRNVMVRPIVNGDTLVNALIPCWYKSSCDKWRVCGAKRRVHMDDIYNGTFEWRELTIHEEIYLD